MLTVILLLLYLLYLLYLDTETLLHDIFHNNKESFFMFLYLTIQMIRSTCSIQAVFLFTMTTINVDCPIDGCTFSTAEVKRQ